MKLNEIDLSLKDIIKAINFGRAAQNITADQVKQAAFNIAQQKTIDYIDKSAEDAYYSRQKDQYPPQTGKPQRKLGKMKGDFLK